MLRGQHRLVTAAAPTQKPVRTIGSISPLAMRSKLGQ